LTLFSLFLNIFFSVHSQCSPGEVDAALKALEEEKCGLDAACTQAAVLEAEAHAPLSGKERWRIPIVLIKMDSGRVLSAGDAKIWDHVSRSLKTQADIQLATEITVQTATSPAQQAAERATMKPLNSFRQVVEAVKPHRLNLTKVTDARRHEARSREKTELSTRRNSSPRNSGRIPSTPRTSSRLLVGTAASQARAQCASEDSQPTPKVNHKKLLKRAISKSGHASNNTSKRSLRMSAHSDSRDNSEPAGDRCASPDADHSGILDCSVPLVAIGENARAGFASQVAAGLSSFAASFSSKNKAPIATNNVRIEGAELKTEKYHAMGDDMAVQDAFHTAVATRHNSLKPCVETEKVENPSAVLGANVKNGAVPDKRRSYFGALLATLVRGDSGQASLIVRGNSSESLTHGDKIAGDPSLQDLSLKKKPSGLTSWLPWRPFGAAAVVPAE